MTIPRDAVWGVLIFLLGALVFDRANDLIRWLS